MHLVFALLHGRGVEFEGQFLPDAFVGVVAEGIGGGRVECADAGAVDGDFESAESVSAGESDAQCGLAFGILVHVEFDGPGGRAAAAVMAPGAGGVGLRIGVQRLRLDPAESLIGRIFRVGIQPGGRLAVRHFLEEPVLAVIALADGVGQVVGEEERIAQAPAPEPIVRSIALEEFIGGAVGVADFPDLLAIADRLPFDIAQVQHLAGFDGDVRLGELAEDAVGEGVQGVGSGSDVGERELAVFAAVVPELIEFGVVCPIDHGVDGAKSTACSAEWAAGAGGGAARAGECRACGWLGRAATRASGAARRSRRGRSAGAPEIIGMRQADRQVGQPGGGRLGIIENEASDDRGPFIAMGILNAVDPVVGPFGFLFFA